jgi:hypothetical protein
MPVKSAPLGKSTSRVEVSNVSPHGFRLLLGGDELFVPFSEFPWFRDASIRQPVSTIVGRLEVLVYK